MFRIADFLLYVLQSGARSLPLVILLGFLMGLILAFQSAVPMRRYGADLFVANLVTISLLRELGPLLAAVILAGRTGSAFAAEIGTMKVNEEIDALTTMGIDPDDHAGAAADGRGDAGDAGADPGAGIRRAGGHDHGDAAASASRWSTIARTRCAAGYARPICSAAWSRRWCSALAVAAIGCRAGLATGVGPRAVGLAATAAVVGGIVATIVLDGVFALMFYRLGL